MAVDKNGNSAAEGLIDANCPVFVRLNLEFPQASWTDTQHAVSNISCRKDSSLNQNPVYFLVALGSNNAELAAHAIFALRSPGLGSANKFFRGRSRG